MTDSMKNGQEGEEENYIPKNPDGEFDVRDWIGHGSIYSAWCKKINEEDRLLQQERLVKYGKDLPSHLPDGQRLTRSGWRMGLRYLAPAERSKGRYPGSKDRGIRLKGDIFDTAAKKAFLHQLERLGSIMAAAAACGRSRYTIHSHINKDQRFREAVEIAKANHNGQIRQSIVDRIKNGDETVKYDSTGKVISREVKPISSAILLHYIQSNDEEFMKKSQVSHLHIGDDSNSNARLSQLAQKLGITMPDEDKKDDDSGEIIDIN